MIEAQLSRSPALIVDASNVMHRHAFGSAGKLSYESMGTGIIFGMLRSIDRLARDVGPVSTVMVAFDSKASKRREIFPGYKSARRAKREAMEPQDREAWADFYGQQDTVRQVLETSGVPCYMLDGYEADDIMAQLAARCARAVLATTDEDMYQVLRPGIAIYKHKPPLYTHESFAAEWGISPTAWPWIKAIAGCTSDSIPGIMKGVGEKKAIKIFHHMRTGAGKLPKDVTRAMVDEAADRNIGLTKLPLHELDVRPRKARVDRDVLKSWLDAFGIHAIRPGDWLAGM